VKYLTPERFVIIANGNGFVNLIFISFEKICQIPPRIRPPQNKKALTRIRFSEGGMMHAR